MLLGTQFGLSLCRIPLRNCGSQDQVVDPRDQLSRATFSSVLWPCVQLPGVIDKDLRFTCPRATALLSTCSSLMFPVLVDSIIVSIIFVRSVHIGIYQSLK